MCQYLHNASAPLHFGSSPRKNIVAVYVDATQSELWAYEGGGIFRHVWLETASVLSAVPFGFAFTTYVNGSITGDDAAKPQTADGALAMPRLDVQNAGQKPLSAIVRFTLADATGTLRLDYSIPIFVPARGFRRIDPAPIPFGSASHPVQLWNIADAPPLYNATASILAAPGGRVIDSVQAVIGVRNALFDSKQGFLLNGVKVTMRGTANHLGFGGVGLGESCYSVPVPYECVALVITRLMTAFLVPVVGRSCTRQSHGIPDCNPQGDGFHGISYCA
eukprot:COSAG01_NODE_4315_length_5140_cov_5.930768_2_plen_277_part_00